MIRKLITFIESNIETVEKEIEYTAIQYEPNRAKWGDIFHTDCDHYPITEYDQEDKQNHHYNIGRLATLYEILIEIKLDIHKLKEENEL
jgi:hypothetical protein